jgi:8-oxo-dGTP diphosphatase
MLDFRPGEEKLERFWVSQAALVIRNNKILILKNALRDNEWLFPGGRVDVGEMRDAAFARELKEELGIDNYTKLAAVDYDIWYTPHRRIPVCTIANLVELKDKEIKLSAEHTEYRWVGEDEVEDYNFAWPKAKYFIHTAFKIHKNLV